MSYQLISNYLTHTLQFLNAKLSFPAELLQNYLSLKTEYLPEIIRTPMNFVMVFLFGLFTIIYYANNLIYNLIGILYPLAYGLSIFNTQPANTDTLVTFNKYWMLFGFVTLIDSLFGFILYLIPGYYYCKLGLIYLLLRNNFMLTNTTFSLLMRYYNSLNLQFKAETFRSLFNFRPKSRLDDP
jgi:hypothetical protein